MEHASPRVESRPQTHYGSVSLVKRSMQTAFHHPHSTASTSMEAFDAESAALTTDLSFLRGGKQYRSRDRISRFLDHSSFGIALDALLALLAFIYVGAYIANTYLPDTHLPLWLWLVELVCASLFAADFLFRDIYLANRRVEGIVSLSGIINILVILPVLPLSFFIEYHTLWLGDSYWRFVYPFRFVKCYLAAKAVLSRCHAYMTPVRQLAILCYIQIVLIIAGAAGIIQIAETSNNPQSVTHTGDWTFFNSFFNSVLVFVTIQTPPADNALSKIFVAVLVIVLILIVPYQISQVLDLGKSFSQYQLATFLPTPRAKHIVLCGDLTPSRIDHFFREVFHDDHDIVDINVVVLFDEEPSTAMVSLLMDPFFEKRVRFIQGSILDVDDAQRAAVGDADAIFVLSRRCEQEELRASDHRTLLRVLAAKRLAPRGRIFAQMHLSSNRHLLEDLDVKNVLYFSEVMHSLLAQNCVCPGFSTLIYNLTSTSSDDNNAWSAEQDNWQQRYSRSTSQEVYSVPLPSGAVIFGKTFAEVASLVYSECKGVLLFAVVSGALASHGKILLNPGDTYTCVGDELAFVVAENRRQADQVTRLGGKSGMPSAWSAQPITSMLQGKNDAPISPRRKTRVRAGKNGQQAEPGDVGKVHLVDDKESTPLLLSVDDLVIDDVALQQFSLAHIVVCIVSPTSFPPHLEYFLGPLRVKALRHHRPVVIVTATLPSEEQHETFRHFRHVFFVKGDPYHRPTLRRAGVDSAHKIVIMGDEGDVAESGSSELLVDASCIALHKSVTSMITPRRAPRVITELANRANVHFITQNLIPSDWFPAAPATAAARSSLRPVDENAALLAGARDRRLSMSMSSRQFSVHEAASTASFSRDFFLSPAFASGLAYSTSLCDSLMINMYFNPMIKSILREFIFASWRDVDYMATPATPPTNGDGLASPGSSLVTPSGSVQRSSLFTVEVPQVFVGKTFEYVYHYLLSSDGILAMGLYRCRPDRFMPPDMARSQVPEDERSMPFGYVYVNPFPQDVLTGNDLLYVLAHKQPVWAS
ncbi:hypothetical protein ATCC90586_001261 [Pythium insidiosum]|nr:hypothetical protein ATCC90586_001261 [Pythium insidiosum]